MSQTRFLDKTLLAVTDVMEQAFFSEAFARRRGLLQSLDIRIKLLTFLLIIVCISLLRRPEFFWAFYGMSLALAAGSRIPLWFFVKRVWLFVPLFTIAIVLPAVLNIVTPGDPVWTILRFDHPHFIGPIRIPQTIAVTSQGLWGALVFVSRVAASVSFAVLFTLTSKWGDVFAGLRALFVPRIFVVTLGMTERYLFVVLRLIQDMYRARKSRTIGPLAAAADRRWIASRIGVTYRRSVEMSEDIYKAMLSRGFHGDFPAISRFRVASIDVVWFAAVLLFSGALLLLERGVLQQ